MDQFKLVIREGNLMIVTDCLIIMLILFSFLFTNGCSPDHSSTYIEIKDGLIYQNGSENPYTGRILDTLDNKIIEYDVLEGMKTGEFCLLSINGEYAVHGFLKNNKNVGPWRYFFSNGKLESEGHFKDDRPHGLWNWYFDSGNIRTIGYYINGNAEGTWRSFDENGRVASVTYYKNGQVQSMVIVTKLNFS